MSSFVIRWARRYARWLITLALLIVVLLLVIFFFKSSPSGIVLVNNSDVFRHEVISIPYDSDRVSLDELREQNVSLFDSCRKLVIYQVTHDGQLLVLASVGPHKSVSLRVADGKPKVVGLASGDVYPERLDDVAWENDLIATSNVRAVAFLATMFWSRTWPVPWFVNATPCIWTRPSMPA